MTYQYEFTYSYSSLRRNLLMCVLNVYMHIRNVYVCIYVHMCIHSIHTRVWTEREREYANAYVYVCVCVCVYMYVCVYVLSVCVCVLQCQSTLLLLISARTHVLCILSKQNIFFAKLTWYDNVIVFYVCVCVYVFTIIKFL